MWFNLKASLVNQEDQQQVKKILLLISELEVKVVSSCKEKLFIANSESLIKLIMKSNLTEILDVECFNILK